MIEFGRDICGDAEQALRREWLVTNGLGSYASGTLAGANTRCYHGVLIAALAAPAGRTLLVAKIDATAHLRGATHKLDTNEWADGSIDPPAYKSIESFRLEGTIPTWTYALAEAQLVKRIWMAHGHHTTYLTYTHARGADPIELDLKVMITYRDHHASTTGDWRPAVTYRPTRLRVETFEQAPPYFVKIERGAYTPIDRWYRKFKRRAETERGLVDVEDLYAAGQFYVTLQPGETLAVVASLEEAASLDWSTALEAERQRQRELIEQSGLEHEPAWIQQLVLAADQFIVNRAVGAEMGRSVIAGYPWFGDWGRDTMIALTGLCLTTKRYAVAKTILRTFATFVDQGMLPNRFPDQGEKPEYNTIDATLWYFHAIDQVVTATGDGALVRELYPVLQDIIAWHVTGTRYNIHVDQDGLLYGGDPTVQLTWMDAKVDDWVVTPRIGKPVEINALWIHALQILARFAQQLGDDANASVYLERARQAATSFAQRFWYAEGGYLYDVIDGPHGNDAALRPNQLLAVSLTPTLLAPAAARSVLTVCARELVTSAGLRSLAPTHANYTGIFTGDRYARDGAYHEGTVWSWLIGPFVEAHYTVFKDRAAALSYLAPFEPHLREACLGSISEVFDGDAPHRPKGCVAQAWGVAEVLRVWTQLIGADQPERQPAPAASDAIGEWSELADLRATVEELRRQNADSLALRQTLEAEYHRYREVFDRAPDGYVLTDLEGVISDANRTAAALLSVRQDFLIGKSLRLFMEEGAQASLADQIAQWQQAAPGQTKPLSTILRGQLQLRVYKGATFPADFALSPARDEEGHLTGLRWILRDLSESTRTAQALRESEYHYRTLFDNAGDAIFIHNLTGRYLEVNRVACDSLGYTREELLRMTPADLSAPELINQITDRMAQLRQTDSIFFETVYLRRDGAAVPMELNSRIIEYAGGPAVLSIARDITERKRAEEVLTRRAGQVALLSDIGRQIAAILSLEQVLDRAAHLVQESFGYHHVALFLVDYDRGELVMKAIAGNFLRLFRLNHRIQLGAGMVGWVGAHGQRLLANDVRADLHYINFYPDVIPTCSELSVPIRVGEQTVGVLDVQSPVFDGFDENDVKVIETLADQIAVAIANARLYAAAQQSGQ